MLGRLIFTIIACCFAVFCHGLDIKGLIAAKLNEEAVTCGRIDCDYKTCTASNECTESHFFSLQVSDFAFCFDNAAASVCLNVGMKRYTNTQSGYFARAMVSCCCCCCKEIIFFFFIGTSTCSI